MKLLAHLPKTLSIFNHCFNDCEMIKQFWLQLQSYITNKCSLNFDNWIISDILFSNTELDIVLNKIVFLICFSKMKQIRPRLGTRRKLLPIIIMKMYCKTNWQV
jgi:hypothetical protein